MADFLGKYDDTHYYLQVLSTLDASFDPLPNHRYFRLVTFIDHSQILSDRSLGNFVRSTLAAGARSIVAAGTAAEVVHDCFDEEIASGVKTHQLLDPDRGEFIPTSWWDEEPLDEVLWIADGAFASDCFEEEPYTVVVALVSGDPRVHEIKEIGTSLQERLEAVVVSD